MARMIIAMLLFMIALVAISGCIKSNISGNVVREGIKITTPAVKCYDSDGGDVVDVRGAITIKVGDEDWTNYTDRCVEENSVLEYFCENNSYVTKNYYCDNACIDGMCR